MSRGEQSLGVFHDAAIVFGLPRRVHRSVDACARRGDRGAGSDSAGKPVAANRPHGRARRAPTLGRRYTVYVATSGNHLFVTTTHGATWTDHPLPINGTVADIQIDPADAQIAYAVIKSFSAGGNVFRTVNGGTWTNISGNLPRAPVWSLQMDPTAGALSVGADDGIYSTTNGGATWSRFGTGFPNAQVYQIELNTSLGVSTKWFGVLWK